MTATPAPDAPTGPIVPTFHVSWYVPSPDDYGTVARAVAAKLSEDANGIHDIGVHAGPKELVLSGVVCADTHPRAATAADGLFRHVLHTVGLGDLRPKKISTVELDAYQLRD